jgi:hypothetical protein
MRVERREFTWEFSQHSLLDQTRTRVAWEARVYMRVFWTFIAWSNENKGCMRVDKREFTWEFSQLSLLDQTRTIKSCMRVEKREFSWEFRQHSLLDQTRTRVAWELTSESLHESFLNIHCLTKREQELHENWQARVYMRVSQLSLLDQTRTRVAWELIWQLTGYYRWKEQRLSSKFDESRRELQLSSTWIKKRWTWQQMVACQKQLYMTVYCLSDAQTRYACVYD